MVSARIFFCIDTCLHRNLRDSLDGTIVDDYSFHLLKPSYSKQSLVVGAKTVRYFHFSAVSRCSFFYFCIFLEACS